MTRPHAVKTTNPSKPIPGAGGVISCVNVLEKSYSL